MKRFWLFALIPFAIVAFLALGGWAVQALWNAVMPKLADGIHTIDFYTAIGLFLLSRILVGGWGSGHKKGGWNKDVGGPMGWSTLDSDQKSKMKAYWRRKCGMEPENSAMAADDSKV